MSTVSTRARLFLGRRGARPARSPVSSVVRGPWPWEKGPFRHYTVRPSALSVPGKVGGVFSALTPSRHRSPLFRVQCPSNNAARKLPRVQINDRAMAGEAASGDVESGTATPAEVAAALSGVTLGRSYPATIPECPYCHKRKVQTRINTHATAGTYAICVVAGIFSAMILWWSPLIMDSVRTFARAGSCVTFSSSLLCSLGVRPAHSAKRRTTLAATAETRSGRSNPSRIALAANASQRNRRAKYVVDCGLMCPHWRTGEELRCME